MVFGKKRTPEQHDTEEHYNLVDEEEEQNTDSIEFVPESVFPTQTQTQSKKQSRMEDAAAKPLLDQVTFVGAGNSKNPGGAKVWVCKYCNLQFTSSYSRIHNHFFGTPAGKRAEIRRCTVLLNDRQKYDMLLKKVQAAEKVGVSKTLKNSVISKKHGSSFKKPIEQSFGTMERNAVDLKVMRGLCANGIPFNVLRNPQFQEMVSAINKAPPGYKVPSSEKARTVLLDECAREIEKDLTPIKYTWYSQGVSIVSDGWSNVKHEPLINVMAVNSRGAMFMYSENFMGVEKTGVAIAEFLQGAIENVGPSNVLQVVTDNAANYKAVGREIEKVYKHIFWSPCVVHTLNLIFKDLATKFYWLTNTYKKGKTIVKYFVNHTQALAIFRDNSKLELLKVAKTRFASHYILLKRLLDCREALSTTIVLNSWRDWVKQGDENTRINGLAVAETIKSDSFWEDVENILAVRKPIYLLIKFCDGEGLKMGEIYEKMDNMLGEISDVLKENKFASYCRDIKAIVLARWDKMKIPLHCLGFALTTRFYDTQYLETLAPGGIPRKAPNNDKEVVAGVMEALKRISENDEEYQVLRIQFARFHMKLGLYASPAAHMDVVTMDAIEWWSFYGSETPELAEVAKKILSQPVSSSSAERNWSTYSYIHSVKRNRLNAKRADKLVFIHSNIRIISRFSETYKEGPYKKWDMDPENASLEGSSTRLEEMRWENLDEDVGANEKGKRTRLE